MEGGGCSVVSWRIGWDANMYHPETDAPAATRSTIVTELGLVVFAFSDTTRS